MNACEFKGTEKDWWEMIAHSEERKCKSMKNDIQLLLELCYDIEKNGMNEDIHEELQHIKIKYDIKKEV